jgi:hypothetical protein
MQLCNSSYFRQVVGYHQMLSDIDRNIPCLPTLTFAGDLVKVLLPSSFPFEIVSVFIVVFELLTLQ